ncbi:alpha-L-fucosidase [Streptomyces niger]|uniref:alpha-L-fucosidase n=1 Tax=Streptomyces niger TaxID=66373 RepID=UPI00069925DF|nr:alpha-L-fucosidase [Streptomyces niger]
MSLSRRTIFALGAALPASAVLSRTAAAAGGAHPAAADGIAPAPIIPVSPGDTDGRIVAKAAHVIPTPHQLAWQRNELTVFTHYGMNTFTDREWGSGCEDPAWFAPERVDVTQWMRVYRAAGAKLVMLTAKHHDGFVLYPTRYTRHSVTASAWKGDVLGAYVRAARAAGLKVGVYLSPADGAELPHAWHADRVTKIRAKQQAGEVLSIEEQATLEDGDRAPGGHGRYGNGSARTPRTLPTLVDGDDRARAVARGDLPTFHVTVNDYDAYYLNQVYELFTQYGPIDELWLDGANPWTDAGITQEYDFATFYEVIGELSPKTVVFKAPCGVRWIGNEKGIARESEWSVLPVTGDGVRMQVPGGESGADLGSRERLTGNPDVTSLRWFPGEADVSLRPGWYHHPDQRPKAAGELVALYEQSVGRNAVLLLNVPPAKDGRVAPADVAELTSFRRALDRTYGTNLLSGARGRAAAALADPRLTTGWSPAGGAVTGALELTLPEAVTFDRVRLGEDITRGQRVEGCAVDVWDGAGWRPAAAATTIGYSRILVLSSPVTAGRVRVRITAARATPRLAFLGLYRSAEPT